MDRDAYVLNWLSADRELFLRSGAAWRTMNILYYGCHEILEYDEVRLFRALGHSVFSLGVLSTRRIGALRPALPQDAKLARLFKESACVNSHQDHKSYVFSSSFMKEIDVVIVMNDASFIENNCARTSIETCRLAHCGHGHRNSRVYS